MNALPMRLSNAGFALSVGTFWLWFAWTCAGEWMRDRDYAHGWVVVPLAVYFLWKRLETARVGVPLRSTFAWGLAVMCALFVLPVELGRQAPLYWRVFTWAVFGLTAVATLSLAYLRGGGEWRRLAWFPVIFLGTSVPWPTFIEQPVTIGLAHSVAALVGDLLQISGTPARIEGTVIVLPQCTVGIAEACSGVRSLQSALMLALAIGELFALGFARRLLLIPFAFLIALATNAIRTLVLSMEGAAGGEARVEAMHDPMGWVALLILVAGVLLAAWLMRHPSQSENATPVPCAGGAMGVSVALSCVVAGGVLAANIWYLSHETGTGRAFRPALTVRDGVELQALPDYVRKAIQPTKGNYARLPRADESPAIGYHLVWDDRQNNFEALFHRPDVCMPGVGWKSIGSPGSVRMDIDGKSIDWSVLRYERNGTRALMLWTAWLDGEPLQFSLHTGSTVQQNALMRLIANGRRKFSYEVAAVMIPDDGAESSEQSALDAAREMFRMSGKEAP